MDTKESPQDVIDSYRKRQQLLPFIIGGLAVILVAVGIIVVILSLTGQGSINIKLFSTKTATPTNTPTVTPVTPTATVTLTPTMTETVLPTNSPTPSGPFEYTVKEGENCWQIAEKFEADFQVMLSINNFDSGCPIQPGDTIWIPAPDTELPTKTPLPTDIARGTKIEYVIEIGDSLEQIAARFNSTLDAILKENEDVIEDQNNVPAGLKIIIPVEIVTPTITVPPTSTAAFTVVPPTETPSN